MMMMKMMLKIVMSIMTMIITMRQVTEGTTQRAFIEIDTDMDGCLSLQVIELLSFCLFVFLSSKLICFEGVCGGRASAKGGGNKPHCQSDRYLCLGMK